MHNTDENRLCVAVVAFAGDKGFLLGGVKEHRSTKMPYRDAKQWAETVRDTNIAAGRPAVIARFE